MIVTKPCALPGAGGAAITIDVDADEECAAAIDHVLHGASPASAAGEPSSQRAEA